jgi:hypothetical protein
MSNFEHKKSTISASNIKISGAIGIKIIYNSKLNKKIFIFYDDHSNAKYCKSTKSIKSESKTNLFISELFDNISNQDVAMILEEPFIEPDSKIKILWEDSEHLLLFRKFYTKLINKCSKTKICKLFPIDIRLSIFEISPDEIIFNIDDPKPDYHIKLNKYFENIKYLFNLNEIEDGLGIDSIIIFVKKVFNIYVKNDYYINLKTQIIQFIEKYQINSSDKTIYEMIKINSTLSNFVYEEGFPYVSNHTQNFIDDLDKISSAIMELYSLILMLLLPNNNIIYFAGYYHSNNMAFILQKYYNFKFVFAFGNTDNIEKQNPKEINNCIEINKIYLDMIKDLK